MIDPQAINRMIRMLPGRRDRHQNLHRTDASEADHACGRCPACGEFVAIEHLDLVLGSTCPSCGQMVNRLDALGDAIK